MFLLPPEARPNSIKTWWVAVWANHVSIGGWCVFSVPSCCTGAPFLTGISRTSNTAFGPPVANLFQQKWRAAGVRHDNATSESLIHVLPRQGGETSGVVAGKLSVSWLKAHGPHGLSVYSRVGSGCRVSK